MSGHSKWHKIQHQKGKNDAVRSANFTKLCSAVTVAVGQGGGDPDMNFTLRLAIERAKAGNVPKDNIERAIKRGTGEFSDGSIFEEVTYEGFGPGGIAFIVDAVTDNKNRTVAEIKLIFSKHEGTLAAQGAVRWQFAHLGVIRIFGHQFETDREKLEVQLIEAGIDDIIEHKEGVEIRSSVDNFKTVLDTVRAAGLEPEDAGIEWVAKEKIDLNKELQTRVDELYEILTERDDVKSVFSNAL